MLITKCNVLLRNVLQNIMERKDSRNSRNYTPFSYRTCHTSRIPGRVTNVVDEPRPATQRNFPVFEELT